MSTADPRVRWIADETAFRALLTPEAVRERAHEMLAAGVDGRLDHWRVDLDRLPAAADLVAAVTRAAYPDLAIPLHARWRHFSVGGRDRWGGLVRGAAWADVAVQARAAFDLVIVSVLLDAGAGMAWRYVEPLTGLTHTKSEGLAVASFDMFVQGLFSSRSGHAVTADAAALRGVDARLLARGFQVTENNPLVGLEGRAALLNRLGATVAAAPEVFGRRDAPRPGGLFDVLAEQAIGGRLPARAILVALLEHLGTIWPGRETVAGVELGDCWRHPAIRRADATDGLVPFHKLSQWLSYSLVEPLEAAGITVTDLDALTGLPEYRNGGLFVDTGVLALADAADAARRHAVGDPIVVAWRALTVALLDRIAPLVRSRLGVPTGEFPLAKVLEGGTWAAGRKLAREKRADGGPPLTIVSDGTVF